MKKTNEQTNLSKTKKFIFFKLKFYLQVILFKDPLYEDFGFSISDGLYERGVYLNRIRQGGPADKIGLLQPFDRIIQVSSGQV